MSIVDPSRIKPRARPSHPNELARGAIRIALLWIIAIAAACSAGGSDTGSAGGRAPEAALNKPVSRGAAPLPSFDLGRIMRQVHFAFRQEGSEWTGGHETYAVRASGDGFTVTPSQRVAPEAGGQPIVQSGAPARFETRSLGRGSDLRAAGAATARIEGDAHLSVRRGEAVEHLRNGDEGVEQSFSFDERPAGSGDYVIRVRASGQEYTGETDMGHHFADPETGLGLRYGEATWIDAEGRKTAVAVRFEDGELALTVPEEVLDRSGYPAVLDPTISPEFGMDAPVQVPALSTQTEAAIAFDGTNYMVVWTDIRYVSGERVIAARVAQAGTIVDPGGILLPSVSSYSSPNKPAIAFNGTNYLVAWDATSSGRDIVAARLSPSGVVLDPAGFIISSATDTQSDAAIASDGTNWFVAWTDLRGIALTDVYGTRVLANGTVSTPTGTPISVTGSVSRTPAVAFNGTSWLVVWADFRNGTNDIYGSRITTAGVVQDMGAAALPITTAPSEQEEPSIAFDGTNYLVVWNDQQFGNYDIIGTRVSQAGTVLDPGGIAVSLSAGNQQSPRIAYDGTSFVATWRDDRNGTSDIYGARVGTNGITQDPNGIAISTGTPIATLPKIACATGTCITVWHDNRSTFSGNDIYGARLSAGSVLDPTGFPISIAANGQGAPAVASNGTDYLAVWHDLRSASSYDIYGVRVDAAGTVLDPAGIAISTAANDQKTPAVVWNAPNYLVVWQDGRTQPASPDVYGARVAPNGTVVDPTGFAISAAAGAQITPAVAADGTNYLVVWDDARSGTSTIYSTRVTPAGGVLSAAGVAVSGASGSITPAIAFDGTGYLVAWAVGGGFVTLRGARVSTAGAVLDASPGFSVASLAATPKLVYDGANFMVVYGRSTGVYGTRVTSAGAVLDAGGFPISTGAGVRENPTIAFTGTDSFVAWRDFRNGSADLYGTAVTSGAVIQSPSGVLISLGNQNFPALATGAGGRMLLVYERVDTFVPFGDTRVRARLFAPLAQGLPCATPADCISGFCADGVCCNVACAGGATDCQACSVAAGAAVNGTCAATTGNACNDGSACSQTDTCQSGVCTGSNFVTCMAQDACHVAGVCNPGTGICSNPNQIDGTACNDSNACTQTDTCQSGACTGGNPVTCVAQDACHLAGTCNTANGQCSNPSAPNGTSCSDNNACSQTDACQNGSCVGANPVVCPMADQCHVVAPCDPITGACAVTPKADGTACSDGDACTQGESCQAGACTGGTPVVCMPADQCHDAGTCDPLTGQCSSPAKANGASCDDGDACTQTDACNNGACTGSSPVSCPAPDQCHSQGACDPATGQCSNPSKSDGSACEDGDKCTTADSCQGGVCMSGAQKFCSPPDSCHKTGICEPATGACTDVAKPDGTKCSGGTCQDGTCTPDTGTGGSGGSPAGSGGAPPGVGGSGGGDQGATSGTGGSASGSGGGESGGCGCRTASEGSGAPIPGAIGLAIVALARRRRRR